MKVIKKGQTLEGIVIRVEDWSEDYSCYAYGSLVTAYPKKYGSIRLEYQAEDYDNALLIFKGLTDGTIDFFDIAFTQMISGGNRVLFKNVVNLDKFNFFYKRP